MRTLIVPTEFKTIQEAVDNAQSGDEVLVLTGFYNERVVILTEGITVRGSAFPVEILGDGTGFGITVEADNVKLINLDVKEFQVAIAFRGDNYLLEEMIGDENTEFGGVIFGNHGIIRRGSFSNNGVAGLVISGEGCKVCNNRINNNIEVGIGAFYGEFKNSSIEANEIFSRSSADPQKKSVGISFNLKSTEENRVCDNNIGSNIGIISYGDNNEFENNIIASSSREGIIINAKCNKFMRNTVSECTQGLILNGEENIVRENSFNGIETTGITVMRENNCVKGNSFVDMKVGITALKENRICFNRFVSVCEDEIIL